MAFRLRTGCLPQRSGIPGLIPLRRKRRRNRPRSYPLFATASLGRVHGRPLALGTFTVARAASARFTSAGWALAITQPMPLPDAPLPASACSLYLYKSALFPDPLFSRDEAAIQESLAPVQLPCLSRVLRKALQILSQIPSICHWSNRCQQVTGLPYSEGRSCQRQPVRSIYRMPLMVRWSWARGCHAPACLSCGFSLAFLLPPVPLP